MTVFPVFLFCLFFPNYLLLEIWNTWCFQWIFTLKSDKSFRTADVNALLMLSEFRIFSECVHRHVSGLVVPSHSLPPPYASWLCVFGWLSLGAHLKERDCVKGRSPRRLSGSRVDPDLNWPSHRHRGGKKKLVGFHSHVSSLFIHWKTKYSMTTALLYIFRSICCF